ncbi:MAG: HEAT repeat domain-containing protein, partial [Promethearchaeota archaeon]
MSTNGELEELLAILKSSIDLNKKIQAIDQLIEIQDLNHFDLVKNIYSNESHSEVKIKLIELISNCYKKEGISFLKPQYILEKDWKVRKKIIEAVANIDKLNSLKFLIEALGDSNIEIIKSAVLTLEGSIDALEDLINVLKFRNKELQEILINVIVETGKDSDIQRITQYLDDENLNIKKEIPRILGKLGNKEAV